MPYTTYKGQVKSVTEYTTLAWMSAAATTLKKLDTLQDILVCLIGYPTITHSTTDSP